MTQAEMGTGMCNFFSIMLCNNDKNKEAGNKLREETQRGNLLQP